MARKPNLAVLPNKGKYAISAASLKVRSLVYAKGLVPKGIPTVGIDLRVEDARHLALLLNMVCNVANEGEIIHITGKDRDNSVTVIRRRKKL